MADVLTAAIVQLSGQGLGCIFALLFTLRIDGLQREKRSEWGLLIAPSVFAGTPQITRDALPSREAAVLIWGGVPRRTESRQVLAALALFLTYPALQKGGAWA